MPACGCCSCRSGGLTPGPGVARPTHSRGTSTRLCLVSSVLARRGGSLPDSSQARRELASGLCLRTGSAQRHYETTLGVVVMRTRTGRRAAGPTDISTPPGRDGPLPSPTRAPRPHSDDWEWQLRGACRAHDPEIFFLPVNERGPARAARERRAKQICASCPVLAACRDHAMRAVEVHGVWGGLTQHERAALGQGGAQRRAG